MIELELDVSKHAPEELVNRVDVCGGYGDDEWICARNFSALEIEWLSCCPDEISVGMTADLADEVDPRAIDGSVVQPVRATCVIDVGTVEDECGSVNCDTWQPPNWELEHYGYEPDELTCEDLTCADCGGTC